MSYLNYGDRELLEKARTLRNSMTKAERILWSKLRSKQIQGLKFRRQQPILNYIVDFYCDSLKIIIEVDGEIHFSPDVRGYDKKREIDLKNHGFEFLRFTNEEVELRVNEAVEKIKAFIHEKYNSVR